MKLCCRMLLIAWSALSIISPAGAQSPSAWKGHWLEPEDKAFAFASSDPTIPGTRFHWTESETQLHSGQVFDSDGKPAANAEIWFSGIFGRIPIRERTVSRPDGTFELALPSMGFLAPIQWMACAARGNEASKPIRPPTVEGLDLHMESGRTVVVRVFAATTDTAKPTFTTDTSRPPDPQSPIINFTLHTEDGRVLNSDDQGACSIEGLPPRIQYLGVSAPGYAYRYAMFDLFEDRDYAFSFSLSEGGTVSGNVRDSDGQPVPWNVVSSQTCEATVLNLGRTFTNDQGVYELSGVRTDRKSKMNAFSHGNGQVTYSEEAPVDFQGTRFATADFQVAPNRVEPPRNEVKMLSLTAAQKPQPAILRGRAVLPDGSPCTEFTLRVQPTTSGRNPGGYPASYNSIGIRFASHDGSFVLSGLNLGRSYRLVLSSTGYRDTYVDPVEPVADEDWRDSEPVQFELEKSPNVRLAIVDSNERPVPNATVKLYRVMPEEHIIPYYKDRFIFQGTSDAQGMLELPDVSLSMGRWLIESPSIAEQQFSWNGELEPRITLQKPISMRLRFQFDPDITSPLSLMLISKHGDILHQKEDLSSSNTEWVISGLLPDIYTLAIDSPNGSPELCFDANGPSRFQQQLDARKTEHETIDFAFEIVSSR